MKKKSSVERKSPRPNKAASGALAVGAGSQSDSSMLDFIEANEAWITYASDEAKTARAWRCQVAARHYPSPDIRERSEKDGYGKTARQAIAAAMQSTIVPYFSSGLARFPGLFANAAYQPHGGEATPARK